MMINYKMLKEETIKEIKQLEEDYNKCSNKLTKSIIEHSIKSRKEVLERIELERQY